jgi:hypothetical protein
MAEKTTVKRSTAEAALVCLIVLGALLLVRANLAQAQSGADLTAEISIDPSMPEAGQEVTVTVVIRNVGNAPVGQPVYTYLYVDPVDQPPDTDTPHDYYWPWFLGLPAGGHQQWSRGTYTFTAGCDHTIYVWVDRDDGVSEIDEGNNLVSKMVCAGVECEADAYEEDDTCAAARWITSDVMETHTLCPAGDEDWVKFTALAGLTYTIEAGNLGTHGDPLLYLYDTCDGLSQFGTGTHIEWNAPASGVSYVRVDHRQDTHGPLTSYDLSISASGGSGDFYEPDDVCAMARDISTDGSRQTHLFQAAGDTDWVKFAVSSGDSFVVVADNVAVGVNPLVSLYASCGQPFGDYVNQSADVQVATSAPQTYYAKVANQDPNTYGAEAHYDLSVTASPCVRDGLEDDDSAAAAGEISATGELETHDVCPAGDEDWVHFTAEAGTIYAMQTSNLGPHADTHLVLYDTDGLTQLADNDDYGYGAASQIVWQAPSDSEYYAKVHHHNPNAAGPNTQYDLSITEGCCIPDGYEGDNDRFDAPILVADGGTQTHGFCADPISCDVADQDWVQFDAVGGAPYLIQTSNLGPNSDTVLNLYSSDALTLLASSDDSGSGVASAISITLPADGTYYARVTHYNSGYLGSGTDYQVSVLGEIPPTPTPTATPTPSPTPTPTPTPPPSQLKSLILVNRQQVASLTNTSDANALMSKLHELADHDSVQGLVVEVEADASVAAAYSAWTADPGSLLETDKANAVASAVRNLVMSLLTYHPNVEHIVIVGDDRIIPHRRVPEGDLNTSTTGVPPESQYATDITTDTTVWAACADNMILTDDYYVDEQATEWQGGELYIPDYAVGRLIEHPAEIIPFIDAFLADDTTEVNNVLVTGYDFVQDVANIISTLFRNDNLPTDDGLIGYSWPGSDFRDRQLNASPRFDVQSINSHADHTTEKTPDGDGVTGLPRWSQRRWIAGYGSSFRPEDGQLRG